MKEPLSRRPALPNWLRFALPGRYGWLCVFLTGCSIIVALSIFAFLNLGFQADTDMLLGPLGITLYAMAVVIFARWSARQWIVIGLGVMGCVIAFDWVLGFNSPVFRPVRNFEPPFASIRKQFWLMLAASIVLRLIYPPVSKWLSRRLTKNSTTVLAMLGAVGTVGALMGVSQWNAPFTYTTVRIHFALELLVDFVFLFGLLMAVRARSVKVFLSSLIFGICIKAFHLSKFAAYYHPRESFGFLVFATLLVFLIVLPARFATRDSEESLGGWWSWLWRFLWPIGPFLGATGVAAVCMLDLPPDLLWGRPIWTWTVADLSGHFSDQIVRGNLSSETAYENVIDARDGKVPGITKHLENSNRYRRIRFVGITPNDSVRLDRVPLLGGVSSSTLNADEILNVLESPQSQGITLSDVRFIPSDRPRELAMNCGVSLSRLQPGDIANLFGHITTVQAPPFATRFPGMRPGASIVIVDSQLNSEDWQVLARMSQGQNVITRVFLNKADNSFQPGSLGPSVASLEFTWEDWMSGRLDAWSFVAQNDCMIFLNPQSYEEMAKSLASSNQALVDLIWLARGEKLAMVSSELNDMARPRADERLIDALHADFSAEADRSKLYFFDHRLFSSLGKEQMEAARVMVLDPAWLGLRYGEESVPSVTTGYSGWRGVVTVDDALERLAGYDLSQLETLVLGEQFYPQDVGFLKNASGLKVLQLNPSALSAEPRQVVAFNAMLAVLTKLEVIELPGNVDRSTVTTLLKLPTLKRIALLDTDNNHAAFLGQTTANIDVTWFKPNDKAKALVVDEEFERHRERVREIIMQRIKAELSGSDVEDPENSAADDANQVGDD